LRLLFAGAGDGLVAVVVIAGSPGLP
jgi:hypothetical protein